MIILAIETSCDDTSIAVFEDNKLLVMDTASQIKIHNLTGWVVPEVAAREHANNIFEVLDNVLGQTNLSLADIDYIWVTTNPWLLPSLLTWVTLAWTISTVLHKPIIPINHIEAHIFSNFLDREEKEIDFPIVCLTVSGWHNDIYYMKNMWEKEKIWSSWDDAAWEAFDKVAKMMWLWYPWWPIISKMANEHSSFIEFGSPPTPPAKSGQALLSKEGGDDRNNLFPRVWLVKKEFDFSFSGLKSSVKREVDKRIKEKWELSLEDKKEISYEFENSVVEVLAYKLVNAAKEKNVNTIMLSWWVSANDKLKKAITELVKKENIKFIYPSKNIYSMDNAAMVWINTYYKIKYNKFEEFVGMPKI